MSSRKINTLAAFSLISSYVAPALADIASSLSTDFNTLQTYYNTTSGIWDSASWWQGANVLTMLGNYAAADSSMKDTVNGIFLTTFQQAQLYNIQINTGQQTDLPESFYSGSVTAGSNTTSFTDDFYDDDGWWALAWIQAYDVTGNATYLSAAEDIFGAMEGALDSPCSNGGGGIYWSKTGSYVNAIANELFLSTAAHLANRVTGDDQATYLKHALDQWTWFQNSGLINSDNLINDGLADDCTNNGETVWTYNQGVILGALVELNTASPDDSYLTTAKTIASAAISNFSVNGILTESCEPDSCGVDGTQFKGVFMRNLAILNAASPEDDYATFINDNANSIIGNDTNRGGFISISWAGPFVNPSNASTQSSGMDALVAAVGLTSTQDKKRSAKFLYDRKMDAGF